MNHRKVIYLVPVLNRKPDFGVSIQVTTHAVFGPIARERKSSGQHDHDKHDSSLLFDYVLQEGTTKLIYAFHPDDPSSENNIPQHDMRSMGARSVFLLNTVENVTKLPNGTKSFDFIMNKVTALAFAEKINDTDEYFGFKVIRSLLRSCCLVSSRNAGTGSALRDETKQRKRRRLQGHQTDIVEPCLQAFATVTSFLLVSFSKERVRYFSFYDTAKKDR